MPYGMVMDSIFDWEFPTRWKKENILVGWSSVFQDVQASKVIPRFIRYASLCIQSHPKPSQKLASLCFVGYFLQMARS